MVTIILNLKFCSIIIVLVSGAPPKERIKTKKNFIEGVIPLFDETDLGRLIAGKATKLLDL